MEADEWSERTSGRREGRVCEDVEDPGDCVRGYCHIVIMINCHWRSVFFGTGGASIIMRMIMITIKSLNLRIADRVWQFEFHLNE